jgi:DNA polymerase-1
MSASPSKDLCGTGQKQITFDKVPLGRRPNMPPRMPTSRCGCGCGSSRGWPHEKVTRVYEMVDRPLVR